MELGKDFEDQAKAAAYMRQCEKGILFSAELFENKGPCGRAACWRLAGPPAWVAGARAVARRVGGGVAVVYDTELEASVGVLLRRGVRR